MTTMKGVADTVAGKIKQVVAEIVGDGGLSREGKMQVRKGEASKDQPPEQGPHGDLNQVT